MEVCFVLKILCSQILNISLEIFSVFFPISPNIDVISSFVAPRNLNESSSRENIFFAKADTLFQSLIEINPH